MVLLSSAGQLSGQDNPGGFTLGDLASLTDVPKSRIAEWKRNGFIPTPSRPTNGLRGRSPERFAAQTVHVVNALKRWRRFVQEEDVPIWLWLEGHDHVGVSHELLEQEFQNTIRATWHELQQQLPSLPGLRDGAIDEQVQDRIFDEIDEQYTASFVERGSDFGQVSAAIILSMCGLTSEEDIVEWTAVGKRDNERGGPQSVGYLQATFNIFGERLTGFSIPKLVVPGEVDAALSSFCLPRLSFPRAVSQAHDWATVRTVWRLLCQVTDPWIERPECAPELSLAYITAWRRLCYRQRPGLALFVLASVASLSDYRQLMTLAERGE